MLIDPVCEQYFIAETILSANLTDVSHNELITVNCSRPAVPIGLLQISGDLPKLKSVSS